MAVLKCKMCGGDLEIAAGDSHTVGLKADGTVVAVGVNSYGQCYVSEWTNIALPGSETTKLIPAQ